MFPNYVWDIATNEKVLYLTFDDGPTPEITNWTLTTLKKFNAKATFFCIGNNIEKHPEIFQNILANEHAIGNHTHNHIKGWKTTSKNYLDNIAIANKVMNYELKIESGEKLFRPPYGQITPKQGKGLLELGYKIIMWDVLSFDWEKNVTPENCLKNVTSKATNGSIIVFHDSVKASKNMQFALPKVLEYYSERGFKFKSIF
ncbi:polysaccharide deacetylase family protein [Mariniflexile litorale]|uniref:Polysaccharide deacetylase family protein n=1 Tax=Mariniflexile litorale TaxID=3045158 RepID=A0AAU7ELL4_9FLAO